MIIADENINHEIIKAVRKIPVDVISVYENFRGMSDEDVIFLSKSLDRIILTEDKDFGEWVFSHHIKGISVILLRYEFKEQSQMIENLVEFLKNNHQKLKEKFVTITINKIRIRNL